MENGIKQNMINIMLDSKQYKDKIKIVLNNLKRKVSLANNETELSSIFENELYYFIRSFFGIDIKFEKEVGNTSDAIRHKFSGRMDVLCNNLIIEYKHMSKLLTDKDKSSAVSQVKDYLQQLCEDDKNEYRAILLDGTKIKYFYYHDNNIKDSSFDEINIQDIDIIIKALLKVTDKRFSPINIVKDFKINDKESITKQLAMALFDSINSENITKNTEKLLNEWKILFHLSESDNGKSEDITKRRKVLSDIFECEIENNNLEFKALFCLQTTYAIIIKLIATKTIVKWKYRNDVMYFENLYKVKLKELHSFLKVLESGDKFRELGALNLLEGDFFSWYCIDGQWNSKIGNSIKRIIGIIDGYSQVTFKDEYEPIDIFKDLYMEVMPNAIRHSLGEYFTPAWLADYVIEQAIDMVNKDDWKAIDPCCGSGIFIVTLIRKIIEKYEFSKMTEIEKNNLLEEITKRVRGIDINPISVLTARISYFIAIAPLMSSNSKVVLPIFFGDSAIPAIKMKLGNVECYSIELKSFDGDINTVLPKSFVDNNSFVDKMYHMNTLMKVLDEETWVNKFIKYIDKNQRTEEVICSIKQMASKLYSVKVENCDNIWLKLITNKMLVASIPKVDVIIGNPPWVKWEHLPQVYAENIKSQCIDRHIFSGQTYMGAISLNICALISNVTASEYLDKEGILAFLMPKTLLTQDSYAGFRNFYIDYESNLRLYLQKIDDWSKSGDPFIYTSEKFATYYYSYKQQDYKSDGVIINNINKKKGYRIEDINKHHNFAEVSSFFQFSAGSAFQLDEERTGLSLFDGERIDVNNFKNIIGYCAYKARSGVEFTPYEIFTLEAIPGEYEEGYYKFANFSSTSTVHKAIQASKFGTKLETKFIRPLVKGPNIEPFKINFDNNYGIFPYEDGCTHSIDITKLIDENMNLTQYLVNHKDIIAGQSKRSKMIAKGKEFYSLSKIGEYTFGENVVAFRDNSKMASAVIKPILTHWGELVMPICPKHAPYISMDKDKKFITENEAYYICAILNTKIVADYFRFTFSSRSYSIDLNIKIPKYNKENIIHKELCELSKQAHICNSLVEKESLQGKMNKLYIDLCNQ